MMVAFTNPAPAHVQEGGALGGAKPLMGVTRVISGAEFLEPKRHHPGSVRTIHQRIDAASPQVAHQARNGQNQGRGAGHMVQQRQPRARRNTRHHRGDASTADGQAPKDLWFK
jgi:hypothetical protein